MKSNKLFGNFIIILIIVFMLALTVSSTVTAAPGDMSAQCRHLKYLIYTNKAWMSYSMRMISSVTKQYTNGTINADTFVGLSVSQYRKYSEAYVIVIDSEKALKACK